MSKRKASSRVRRRGSTSASSTTRTSDNSINTSEASFDPIAPAPSHSFTSLSSSTSSISLAHEASSSSSSSILSPVKSKRRVRHRVKFSKKKQVREIDLIRDQDEIDAIWWNDDDYDDFGENNYKMVQKMQSPRTYRTLMEMDNHYNGNLQDSPRGLEFHLPEAAARRMMTRHDAASDVLKEQDLQRQEGIYDDELIANCYRPWSVKCSERALMVGLRDARVALNQEKQHQPEEVLKSPSGRNQSRRLSLHMEESPSRRAGRRSSLASLPIDDGNASSVSWQSSHSSRLSRSYARIDEDNDGTDSPSKRSDYRLQRERFLRAYKGKSPSSPQGQQKKKMATTTTTTSSSTSRRRAGRRGSLLASGAPRTTTNVATDPPSARG